MSLTKKYLLVGITAILIVPFIIGKAMYNRLKRQYLHSITEGINREMEHLDFALKSFFDERKNDLIALKVNPIVCSRDDKDFTNFLEADEATFKYNYGPTEKKIIEILNILRTTHPFVNSVYMGRENGSFVR